MINYEKKATAYERKEKNQRKVYGMFNIKFS